MSNALSAELLAQIFSQESRDPYLTLVTISHPSFDADLTLVNNSVDVVSRGITFLYFPMKIKLPIDDGESARELNIDFDNVSLFLISKLRSITDSASVKIEMILASIPDVVQTSIEDLKIQNVTYNSAKVSCKLVLDGFLNVAMTSEIYSPSNFPGLF